MIVTPEGRLSQYFYGIDYPTRDLRLALVEASQGKIGNVVDQVLLTLLPLRPAHRPLRPGDSEHRPHRRRAHRRWRLLAISCFRCAGESRAKPHLACIDLRLTDRNDRFQWTPNSPSSRKPPRRSPIASIDCIRFCGWLTLVFAIADRRLILYFAVKYRRANKVDRTQVPTSIWMELRWMVAPLPILLLIFFWGAEVFFAMYRPPDDAMEFTVVGKQWMWKFQHPSGRREIDVLHVPVGPAGPADDDQPGRDPQLLRAGVSREAGRAARAVHARFGSRRPKSGEYHLFCAEYCGTNHSRMSGRVDA